MIAFIKRELINFRLLLNVQEILYTEPFSLTLGFMKRKNIKHENVNGISSIAYGSIILGHNLCVIYRIYNMILQILLVSNIIVFRNKWQDAAVIVSRESRIARSLLFFFFNFSELASPMRTLASSFCRQDSLLPSLLCHCLISICSQS